MTEAYQRHAGALLLVEASLRETSAAFDRAQAALDDLRAELARRTRRPAPTRSRQATRRPR